MNGILRGAVSPEIGRVFKGPSAGAYPARKKVQRNFAHSGGPQ